MSKSTRQKLVRAASGVMGPVEKELRSSPWKTPFFAFSAFSNEAWAVCMDSAEDLKITSMTGLWTHWVDIMSNAIEASETLKL